MAYNPTYQPHQQPHSGTNPSQFGTAPPMLHPVHPSYVASVPRNIPGQGQVVSQESPAHSYPGSAQQYGTTPPQPYGTSPSRQQMYGTTPPQAQQMLGTSPSQFPPMYGTSPSQQQHLAPYSSQPGYPPQSQPGYGYPPHPVPYSEPAHSRARAGSTSSYQSHKSHRSTHSKRSHYDEKDSRRKNSRVSSPRPSMGDTMVMLWGSLKGAFDTRK